MMDRIIPLTLKELTDTLHATKEKILLLKSIDMPEITTGTIESLVRYANKLAVTIITLIDP